MSLRVSAKKNDLERSEVGKRDRFNTNSLGYRRHYWEKTIKKPSNYMLTGEIHGERRVKALICEDVRKA